MARLDARPDLQLAAAIVVVQRHLLLVQAVIARVRHLEVDPNKDGEAVALTAHRGHLRLFSNSKTRFVAAFVANCIAERFCAHHELNTCGKTRHRRREVPLAGSVIPENAAQPYARCFVCCVKLLRYSIAFGISPLRTMRYTPFILPSLAQAPCPTPLYLPGLAEA